STNRTPVLVEFSSFPTRRSSDLWWGKWEERQPSWFMRTATEHFSTKDQKLTLALAAPGPEFTDFEVSRDHWKLAREADARITTQDRKSTRLNSSHVKISYAVFCL